MEQVKLLYPGQLPVDPELEKIQFEVRLQDAQRRIAARAALAAKKAMRNRPENKPGFRFKPKRQEF